MQWDVRKLTLEPGRVAVWVPGGKTLDKAIANSDLGGSHKHNELVHRIWKQNRSWKCLLLTRQRIEKQKDELIKELAFFFQTGTQRNTENLAGLKEVTAFNSRSKDKCEKQNLIKINLEEKKSHQDPFYWEVTPCGALPRQSFYLPKIIQEKCAKSVVLPLRSSKLKVYAI